MNDEINRLEVLTKIVMAGFFLATIVCTIQFFFRKGNFKEEEYIVLKYLSIVISYIGMTSIMFLLDKIIKSIKEKNPFDYKNVKRFKLISKVFWVFTFISMFKEPSQGITIIGFDRVNGPMVGMSINLYVLTLAIVALLTSVLSYVFKYAYKVKNEAEELKNDQRYTI